MSVTETVMPTRLLETAVAECGASAFTRWSEPRRRFRPGGTSRRNDGSGVRRFLQGEPDLRCRRHNRRCGPGTPSLARRRRIAQRPRAAIKRAASARGNLTGAQFGGCLKKNSACLQMGARLLKSIREIEDFVVPLHR